MPSPIIHLSSSHLPCPSIDPQRTFALSGANALPFHAFLANGLPCCLAHFHYNNRIRKTFEKERERERKREKRLSKKIHITLQKEVPMEHCLAPMPGKSFSYLLALVSPSCSK